MPIKLDNEKIKPLLDKLHTWCENGQLEPRNYEVLTNMIKKCENYDDAISILEIATQSRKTGLFYRHQFEIIDTSKIHFLTEDKKMSFGSDNNANKLIIGDNYLALENLLITYRGNIDVIYIDPPYGCNDMGEFANVNYQNNISRDNLLSQLSPRLELAYQLLSNDGVIFISIDDKNYAYIKCLMDDIFGESNFLATFNWNKTSTPPSLSKTIRKKYEYVICYKKCNFNQKMFGGISEGGDMPLLNDSNKIIDVTFKKESLIFKIPDGTYKPGQYDRVTLLDKITIKDGKAKNDLKLRGPMKWTQDTINEEIDAGTTFYIKSDKFAIRYCRLGERIKIPSNVISKHECNVGTNEDGAKQLESIFNMDIFAYPKPTSLISYLVNMCTYSDKEAIVLDFYAGSGTTGQAVLELNKSDGGNRKFILCTNEDTLEGKLPHGVGTDVTFERLKRIMTGKATNGEKFDWIEENKPFNQTLKVYKIDEIDNDDKSIFEKIDCSAYDFNPTSLKKKIEWICKNFEQTQKLFKEVKE